MVRFKKISRLIILLISLASAFFLYKVPDIGFDYDFEAFFAENEPSTVFLNEHRKRFETDNDFIFVSLENNGQTVFDQDFLNRVKSFTNALGEDTLVESVQSLTNMEDFVKTSFSPTVFSRPYINIDSPEKYPKDSIRIFERPELAGLFIREDAKALMVFAKHRPYMSKANADILKANIDEQLKIFNFENDYKYAGRAIGMGFYIDSMQFETVFFIGLSFGLIIVFLIISFKSVWGVLVPLTIVSCAMLWIVGVMSTIGQPINLVLTVLPSIIFVVAMSDVIHLVTKYFDELRLGAFAV